MFKKSVSSPFYMNSFMAIGVFFDKVQTTTINRGYKLRVHIFGIGLNLHICQKSIKLQILPGIFII